MKLSTSNILTRGEISDNLLSNPTTFQDTRSRVGEAPFEVWDNAVVCGLLAQIIGILQVQLMVGAALQLLLGH